MTHTVTHTTKRVDGSNGTDGADVRNTPDRKAPKALKTARRSTPIHFVISRSCVRVTPPAPKSIENFGFRCFFVAKTLKMVWVKMWVNCLTHTLTHTTNKLYPRKWTRDFDPWSRSADTHLTHRGSQRLCRLLPAHAPWVQRNARKDPKSTGEKLLPFRCSACLRDLSNLRHEAAHFLRGLLLHLPCDVGVGSQGESRVVVTEH